MGTTHSLGGTQSKLAQILLCLVFLNVFLPLLQEMEKTGFGGFTFPNPLTPGLGETGPNKPDEVTAMDTGVNPPKGIRIPKGKKQPSVPNSATETAAPEPSKPVWGDDVVCRVKATSKRGKGASAGEGRYVSWLTKNLLPSLYQTVIRGFVVSLSREKASTSETRMAHKRPNETASPDSGESPAKRPKENEEKNSWNVYFHYKIRDSNPRIRVEDLAHISAHFRNKIDELDGTFIVKMGGIRIYRGFGFIPCHDLDTSIWVQGVVKEMGKGAFALYEEKDVRLPMMKVGMWIKEAVKPDPIRLFETISKQNGGLNTASWQMLSAQPTKGGHFLLVLMDEGSYQFIQPPYRIYYYEDRISFSFKEVGTKK